MVFWRVMGWKDDEDEAEDLEAGWSIVATGIIGNRVSPGRGEGSGASRRVYDRAPATGRSAKGLNLLSTVDKFDLLLLRFLSRGMY
jgi:hypothetical protein